MERVAELKEALPESGKLSKFGLNGVDANGDHKMMQVSIPVQVEVCQNPCSTVRKNDIKEHAYKFLSTQRPFFGDQTFTKFDDPFLTEHVKCINIVDTEFLGLESQAIDLGCCSVQVNVYQLHDEGPSAEDLDEDEQLAAANHWLLPASEFDGLWENLVFDKDIKAQLLQYARTTLLFSDAKVDSNIIAWNRVVLLHGPPGTGKTSLCKALAQKLSIAMSDRYSYGQLIEINSHSLFSKWFSESGKLVMKMFQKIQELIDDRDALICVLIDEVESLTAARKASMGGTEPSDAIRVVNALLTQIDQIKSHPNVMILTTSNITGAIDLAFVDRADIKQFIGLPSPAAIYKIYLSCLNELMRGLGGHKIMVLASDYKAWYEEYLKAEVIAPRESLFDLQTLELMRFTDNAATHLSLRLKEIAVASEGLSGRTLRKIPFLAHALYITRPSVDLASFLTALSQAVKKQFQEREELNNT